MEIVIITMENVGTLMDFLVGVKLNIRAVCK